MYTWGYIKECALAKLDMDEDEALDAKLLRKFPYYANEVITQISSSIKPKQTFAEFTITSDEVGRIQKMPKDFISFGADRNTITYYDGYYNSILRETNDDDYAYNGYNELIFWKQGVYRISYNARWFSFYPNMENSTVIDVPVDIAECIPSYIAHQCYKTVDEYKASVLRNEYEMFLARIDDTRYYNTSTLHIKGDW